METVFTEKSEPQGEPFRGTVSEIVPETPPETAPESAPAGGQGAPRRVGKLKEKFGAFNIVLFVLLCLFSLVLLVVIFWSLVASLTDGSAYELEKVKYGLPFEYFTFDNYINAYMHLEVTISTAQGNTPIYTLQLLFNSLVYAVGSALLMTFVTCTMAYLSAKYPFKMSKIIYNVVIVVMIIPIVGELPSMSRMLTYVGLYDNLAGMYLMRAGFANLYFLVFYATFKSVSWSYGESAFMDGASHLRVYVSIFLPLVKSIFFTVFLLNFIVFWNEYQIPMVLMPSMPTIAQGVYEAKASFEVALAYTPSKIAVGMLVCVPIFVLFVIFNKRLMGNLSAGGLKG